MSDPPAEPPFVAANGSLGICHTLNVSVGGPSATERETYLSPSMHSTYGGSRQGRTLG
jgi:hypothetical protein